MTNPILKVTDAAYVRDHILRLSFNDGAVKNGGLLAFSAERDMCQVAGFELFPFLYT